MSDRVHRTVSGTVRAELSRDVFAARTSRLIWVPVHLLVVALGFFALHHLIGAGFHFLALLPLSLVIGASFAGLAFVAHEALHGALTRQKTLRGVVGFLGFAPFCVSPLLWVAWHNRVHHGNTNVAGIDPDAYPTMEEYRQKTGTRLAVKLAAPRKGSPLGIITYLIGFSLQATHMLLVSRKRKYLSPGDFAWALLHSAVALSFWVGLALSLGTLTFVMAYVLPLIFANSIVMAHITTNHSLSPLTGRNDTLATSLTVTVPRCLSFLTLGFGYHVEHHLFPSMSNHHGPAVRKVLQRLYSDRYQTMPLSKALVLLFQTPRPYLGKLLLIDPKSGETFPTLGTSVTSDSSHDGTSGLKSPDSAASPGSKRRRSLREGLSDYPRSLGIPGLLDPS